ncbi:ABC transporter substrate-binding protein [Anaerobacillus alkalilacustris]|uniref:ABC transporter substrate-binding protein n=1 Tax=Anaerobacillus alkalilacustris TaxID=393763 RepID=A0A1S2LYY2_9BACI|nr:ABC transporter substrate-binding protein [Anaerobacillus alkalilacustris]OIJ17460.1 ABC transporter substrate-binding protein [Anaerobacillus alkalilacustris]
MKKVILGLLLVSIMMLAACSSGSNETASETETEKITVWAWDPNFNIKAMNLARDAYASVNPDLEIEIIEYAQNDIIQKLNTSLSSGTKSGLPNIVLIEDYRAQSFLQAYPDAFHKLTGSFNTNDFAQYKIAPTSLDGENYGLPFDTGVTGMYVRTDYLEQAGYTIDDVTNIDWNDYIEIGKKVKEVTGKHMLTLDPNDLGLVRMMIQSSGSWYLKEDGTTPDLIENEALKEAFSLYKELIEADLVKPVSDWSQFLAGFNGGDVATVVTGNWITPSVKAEASQSGNWAVVAQPRLPGMANSVNASNLGGSSWYVLDLDGKEEATDFLAKTFGSNVELYQKFVTEIGAMGTYNPASEGEAYQVEDKFFSGQQILVDFSKWSEAIPQVNYGLHTYVVEDILVVAMQDYLNGKDIDSALKEAQQQADAQIR